jgi:hypothetical protein
MRAPRPWALLLLLGLPLLAQTGAASAGAKPEPQLVLVDAVVTGQNGEPVHGLAAADFHVFEDGKEQSITGLLTHTGPAVTGISQQQHVVLMFGVQSADDQ